jgi:hypothetical protein
VSIEACSLQAVADDVGDVVAIAPVAIGALRARSRAAGAQVRQIEQRVGIGRAAGAAASASVGGDRERPPLYSRSPRQHRPRCFSAQAGLRREPADDDAVDDDRLRGMARSRIIRAPRSACGGGRRRRPRERFTLVLPERDLLADLGGIGAAQRGGRCRCRSRSSGLPRRRVEAASQASSCACACASVIPAISRFLSTARAARAANGVRLRGAAAPRTCPRIRSSRSPCAGQRRLALALELRPDRVGQPRTPNLVAAVSAWFMVSSASLAWPGSLTQRQT